MKITIIQFSPSGNTLRVSEMIKKELEERGQQVKLIDITGNKRFFLAKEKIAFLNENIEPHDVLMVGGPVYAHHLQYHVIDLINALPKPDSIWGKYAIPFVTYGGISSGIALKEASKSLKKSGRIVHAGMKVSAPHKMTRAFMLTEFNSEKLTTDSLPLIKELINRVMQLQHNMVSKSSIKHFHYNGFITMLKANIIFKEKMWHKKRYPNILINQDRCTNCGKCVKSCPVSHLVTGQSKPEINKQSACIHCLVCASECPQSAIELLGNLEKGRKHMRNNIAKNGNKETPETSVYPIMENKLLSGKSKPGNILFMKMASGLESRVRYRKYNPNNALKAAGVDSAKNILEVGCGSGFYTIPAAQMLAKGSNYMAIDIHPIAIETTTKKLQNNNLHNIKVEKRNALNTMLPDNSFDAVLLFGVIPSAFLPVNKLMAEMCRITQRGASLSVWTLGMPWLPRYITENSVFEYVGNNNNVYNFVKR